MRVAGKGQALRTAFLRFFQERGHRVLPSAPIIPHSDPSLLFVSAGMVPLKQEFLRPNPQRPRLASVQKCVRAGGKHNDLDNVGHTARHQTFFEMLGNFSMADYGKEEAIVHAWSFLTEELGLPAARLKPSVFKEDKESLELWRKVAGFDSSRVLQLGKEDNFWSMGDTGPCGPCTEIYWMHDLNRLDGEELLEIWNLVFMQYNVPSPGAAPVLLPRPCVDTGMGLERLTSVLANVPSNYDTDLIHPIISALQHLAYQRTSRMPTYTPLSKDASSIALRVVADHLRSSAFLIAEGLVPSPAGRGYILRRLIRRAAAHTRHLGITDPCLSQLLPALELSVADAYPELTERREQIATVLRTEEEVFARQERNGMAYLDAELARIDTHTGVFPSQLAVRLWTSHGFPLESSVQAAKIRGMTLDETEVIAKLAELKRVSPLTAQLPVTPPAHWQPPNMAFGGYTMHACEARVVAISELSSDGTDTAHLHMDGERMWVCITPSPFYAEAGGQVGDSGSVRLATGETLTVERSVAHRGSHVLLLRSPQGTDIRHLLGGGHEVAVTAEVDVAAREATSRHHTATHLLHSALRAELGPGVLQSGSHVSPHGLRFDFVFTDALSPLQLASVEERVMRAVLSDASVRVSYKALAAAKEAGAMAIFSEKYGDNVRVVEVSGHSLELCGGTHVDNLAELYPFRIVSESSVGAGVRRVEAVTGPAAVAWMRAHERTLRSVASMLHVPVADAEAAVARLVARAKSLENQLADSQRQLLGHSSTFSVALERRVEGVLVPVLLHMVPPLTDEAVLREKCDSLRKSAPATAHLLLSGTTLLCALDPVVAKNADAAAVLKAAIAGEGKGGGKSHLARGTVKDSDAFMRRFKDLPEIAK